MATETNLLDLKLS